MKRSFRRLNTSNEELDRMQGNIDSAFTPLLSVPISGGNLVTGVQLIAGKDNPVSHKLDGVPNGWILAGQNANAVVWEKTSPAPTRLLNLWCSANCTINLWVF